MAQLHTILWSPAPASALYTRVFYARLQLEGSCSSTQVSFLLLLDFLLVRTDLFSAWRRQSLNTNQLSWTIFLQGLIIWDSSKQISEKFEACSSVGKRSNPRAFFFFFLPLISFNPELHHVLISTSNAALTFTDFQLFD